jgi:hypothetical protein
MQNDLINIPYIAHESEVARQERTIKRLWILSIVIFLAFVISNAGWIVYESSFEDRVTIEAEQEGSGTNIISGRDLSYGSEGQNN